MCGCSEGSYVQSGGGEKNVTIQAIKKMSYGQLISYLKSRLKKSNG